MVRQRIERLPYWLRHHQPLRYWLKDRWQRAVRGWSVSDAWSFQHYLSGVIAGGVAELRRADNGHPGNLTHDEWRSILWRIERGFDKYHRHDDWDDPTVQEAMTLFTKWFPHLWD